MQTVQHQGAKFNQLQVVNVVRRVLYNLFARYIDNRNLWRIYNLINAEEAH